MKNITIEKYLSLAVIVAALAISFATVSSAVTTGDGSSEVNLGPGQSWKGSIPAASKLSLEGRIVYEKPAGANYVLALSVNGKPVVSPLLNKGQSFKYNDGRTFSYKSGDAWMLFYSANMSANNSTAGGGYQVMTDPGQAYRYSWDVSALSSGSSEMQVEIKNVGDKYTIVGRITSVAASTFPIPELGNCTSTENCKKYCDDSANIAACATFAEKNGMISKEEAAQAKEFADVLRGEGPGACKTKEACEAYCNGIGHIDECVTFASKHNLIPPDQLEQAQKVAKAIKGGAQLPGGCTDKKSCDTYCADASHADSCLAFAEKAGFLSGEELAKAKKVLPLIASGDSPGKCKTKEACEAYCSADGHAVECAGFAEKAGFMTKEEADMVRKTGGKGPGGCKSKEVCETYCNAGEHQEECFKFAEENNLIPADKLKEMKEGMGRLRAGLSQAPKEAIDCLKQSFGDNVIGKIESGQFTPGQKDGETIKNCFAAAMPKIKEKLDAAMKMATPEVKECLDKGLGEGGIEKMTSGEAPTPEAGDVMRNCFGTMKTEGLKKLRDGLSKIPPEMRTCMEEKLGKDTVEKIASGADVEIGPEMGEAMQACAGNIENVMKQKMEEGLSQAPPEMQDCIKSKLGNIGERVKSGELNGEEDVQKLIQECVQSYRPAGIPSGAGGPPSGGIPAGGPPAGIPKGGGGTMGIEGGNAPNVPKGGIEATPDMCANFKMVPSCSYVPAEAREVCEKCKGQ